MRSRSTLARTRIRSCRPSRTDYGSDRRCLHPHRSTRRVRPGLEAAPAELPSGGFPVESSCEVVEIIIIVVGVLRRRARGPDAEPVHRARRPKQPTFFGPARKVPAGRALRPGPRPPLVGFVWQQPRRHVHGGVTSRASRLSDQPNPCSVYNGRDLSAKRPVNTPGEAGRESSDQSQHSPGNRNELTRFLPRRMAHIFTPTRHDSASARL